MPIGTLLSLTDTNTNIRSVADVIKMLDWTEAPLLRVLDFTSANAKKFNLTTWPSTKAELLEDTMPAFASTLSAGINNSVDEIPVAVGTGQYFRTGDIIAIMNATGHVAEKMLVDFVTGDTLTVVGRGYGTTSAASHDSGRTVRITTRAMPEASPYTTGYTTLTTSPFNYTQIISEAVTVSRTAQRVSKYSPDDLMDYHVSKLFADAGGAGRLAQFLAGTFYYGEAVQRTGATPGSMGGFKHFVTTNVVPKNGDPIQRDDIHTMLRTIRQDGGMVTHLLTGAWGIEKLTAMYEGTISTSRDETLGGSEITSIMTPHGKVKLVYDWMCPPGEYYFMNVNKAGWLPFDDFKRGPIASQGDYMVTDVVGEYTFLVSTEKSHGYIWGAAEDA